ncbi:hypothetical protein LINPERHAP1_LOCUS9854 [Linum perenne]
MPYLPLDFNPPTNTLQSNPPTNSLCRNPTLFCSEGHAFVAIIYAENIPNATGILHHYNLV